MSQPSILSLLSPVVRRFHQWLLLVVMIVAAACGGRSDEGLMPPDLDASIDGSRLDAGRDGDASSNGDASLDGSRDGLVLPDGSVVLPDGSIILPDGARLDSGGMGPTSPDGGRLPDGGTTATLTRITIDPPVVTLGIATSQALKVTGVYSDGTTADITRSGVTYSSSANATATVTTTGGVVTAVAAGTATITATRQPEGYTATAVITVTPAMVTSIAVTPTTQTIGVGGSVNFTATATMNDGSHQDVTNTVTWTSSDMAVASIGTMAPNVGLAQGLAAGMTTIKATMPSGGVSGSATLTVTASPLASIAITPPNPILPVGVTFSLKATATYANGMTGDVTNSVVWASSNTAVGTIGAATGQGNTLAPGASMITASLTQGGMTVTGTTNLTVTAAKVVSISVTPAMSTVIVGLKQKLTATGRFDNNTTLDITQSASWSSSNATSAFVSTAAGTAGEVSGLAAGMATITATLSGVNGTAQVTVVEAKLTAIAITPAAPSVPVGATIPLTANGTYDNGQMADVTALVTWSTAAAATATISNAAGSNGRLTGVALGTTTARAVFGGITAEVPVTVTAAIPQSVEITPANPMVQITRTQQMKAEAVYTDGSRVDVTTQATWTTGRAATATISNGAGSQGVATAVAVGTTTITAAWSGLMGTTNITVTPAIPTSITVTPFDTTIATGGTQTYTAVVIYDIGTQATVTGQCMWTSSDNAVATIMLGGGGGGGGGGQTATARGLGGGTTTITCTYTAAGATVAGTATLKVTPPRVAVSLNITPDPAEVTPGATVSLTATVTYDNGTTATVTNTATWTSSNMAVATVATTGMGRGVVTGGNTTGMTTITASYVEGGITVTGTAAVTMTGTPVEVLITPGNVTLPIMGTQNYTTQVRYSDGVARTIPVASTEMICVSSDPGIATIQPAMNNRQGRCLTAGMVTLTCTYTPAGSTMSVSGTTPLNCQDNVPTSISILPTSTTVSQGTTVQFTATATFMDGSTQNITASAESTWDSNAPTVATVDNTGMTKGLARTPGQGTATVTVTFRGVTGTAMITVGPVAPIGLTITPAGGPASRPSETLFTATLRLSDGTSSVVTDQCNWTVTGNVDGGGLTGVTLGNATGTKGRLNIDTTAVAGTQLTVTATYSGTGNIAPATVRVTIQ